MDYDSVFTPSRCSIVSGCKATALRHASMPTSIAHRLRWATAKNKVPAYNSKTWMPILQSPT